MVSPRLVGVSLCGTAQRRPLVLSTAHICLASSPRMKKVGRSQSSRPPMSLAYLTYLVRADFSLEAFRHPPILSTYTCPHYSPKVKTAFIQFVAASRSFQPPKLEGRRIGRAPLKIDRGQVVRDRCSGMSLTQVAKKRGVSRASVCRLMKETSALQLIW